MSHTDELANYLRARWREEPRTPDVAAKLRILDNYRGQSRSNEEFECSCGEPRECGMAYECGTSDGIEDGLGMALETLVQVYEGREDFRPQWRHLDLGG